MPNIMVVLKEEISRVARKEIRSQIKALAKASADYRKKIADMRRQISELQSKVKFLEKQAPMDVKAKVKKGDTEKVRFSPRGLRSNRKRLGLSAADYGKLVGVTAQTVYKWEKEGGRPREQQVVALAALRSLSKTEVQARLEGLSKEVP